MSSIRQSGFCHCHKILKKKPTTKEETFILVLGFSPQLAGSITLDKVRENIILIETCGRRGCPSHGVRRQGEQGRNTRQGMQSWKCNSKCMKTRSLELRDVNGSLSDSTTLENFLGSDATIYYFCF